MGSPGATAFVGRVDELQRLRDCAAALAGGQSAIVLLEGEAGAGKTRMVEELRATALAGALEYARAPYAPIRDLLVALAWRFPKVLKSNAALADALRPVLELHPPDAQNDDAAQHRKMLDAVMNVLIKFSATEPLVLAIEDAHWIDRASADVLTHVARNIGSMRVTLIVTYRGNDAAQREESRTLLAHLTRVTNVHIALKPLSNVDAMLLVDEAAPKSLPLSVRRTICELAQGNPLLLLELTRHVSADPDALRTSLPVSVQALIHDRLHRFDERDRQILQVCAAVEVFKPSTIAEITQTENRTVLTTLRKTRDAGIVAEAANGEFVFRHALIRRAVTDDLLAYELAELHAKIARRLESEPSSAHMRARLAYHYWMAGEIEPAQHYNMLAAQDALGVYAYDDAAMLMERAIGGRDPDAQTYDFYYRLAETYERAGRYKQAVDVYRRLVSFAQIHRSPSDAARAGIDLSRACYHALDDEGSIMAARDALATIDPARERALAFELNGLLGWYFVHLRRLNEANAALDEAARYIETADVIPLIRYHEARAAHAVHSMNGGDWRRHLQNALDLADGLDVAGRIRRYTNAMALACASNLDDFAFAFALFDRLKPALEGAAGSVQATAFQGAVCWMQFVCGRLDEATSTLEHLLPYVGDSAIDAFRVISVGIPLALRTGDDRLLRACVRPRLLEEAFASKDPVVFGQLAAAVAEHLIAQGRAGEAMALVERTINRIHNAGNNFEILLMAARVGSTSAAERSVQLLEPWIERSRSAHAVMELIRAYQSTGKQRAARAASAAQLFAALPWPLHQAQALELAGESDAALSIYSRIGAAAEVARMEMVRRRDSTFSNVLSKRESEVAQLVAEGNSNRAIAARLVLSERTVENHIASIFAKLNMRSRAEIASFVAREKARAV